ncbi:hypothetical protein [Rhizobium ruizarguesonis]|uniref:hypothetical protein n=1 Tax=Rhizobium ruizarguesonis TaxID=2081791 RepID=UPI0010324461|nr:hypothetical protein [Rhizobium ruizarguesonis]TBD43310.1 hypothetical protein ELH19_14310 [Rhizobium ruizarguesonis]
MLAPPSLSIGVQNSPFIGIQNLHAETHERLQKMTPEQRATLHDNARKRIDNGGREIIELFESSGLPLSSGGMRLSDPVYQRMEEIVWSSEGKKAAVAAPAAGLPALAGVEPLIVADLGDRYHPHNDGTKSAGGIVGELMRFLLTNLPVTRTCL